MGTPMRDVQIPQNLVLQRIWDVEQEILDTIDSICRKHGLHYSLIYGTLLGAVRHTGFIPWDDDIDIIMPRNDYIRFIQIWKKEGPEDYVLADRDLYSDYPNNFMKVFKKHTTFLQNEADRGKSFPKGIFVDIFPADRFAPGPILRKIQFFSCLINMLLTRNYSSGNGGAYAFVENSILKLPPNVKERMRIASQQFIERWNDRRDLPYLVPVTVPSCKRVYPANMLELLTNREFRGKQYLSVEDYDTVLKIVFGDYMKLPPENERVWKHHPILLDFEKDLEEFDHEQSE